MKRFQVWGVTESVHEALTIQAEEAQIAACEWAEQCAMTSPSEVNVAELIAPTRWRVSIRREIEAVAIGCDATSAATVKR